MATLVAGIDSSTQSCKVVVRDADTGQLLRSGRAPHPDGTEIDPAHWWTALQAAIAAAGGLDDIAAVSVAAQQHGMVCLDDDGQVVRPALLWNDTRSAAAALDLIAEHGGGEIGRTVWARATGSVPVASFTVSKLRWLAQHEPASARRTVAVCLPHDWLTWRLAGEVDGRRLDELITDRGDASGTGYFSPETGAYRRDLLTYALGHDAVLPKVLAPAAVAGQAGSMMLGPGTGDNAAASLGLGTGPGDVVVSIGTSGVAAAVSDTPTADPSGIIAGFADATGRYLPLVATLNAARVLSSTAAVLGVDLDAFSRLALSAPPGAAGLVMVPYLEGERTPNRPDATGALHGLTLQTMTPAMVARAAVEGLLCGLADGIDALVAAGVTVQRVLLIGGGARSEAVRRMAPMVFGRPVVVPEEAEYVADGAARQAAWVLSGEDAPPTWATTAQQTYAGEVLPAIRARYGEVCDMVAKAPHDGPGEAQAPTT